MMIPTGRRVLRGAADPPPAPRPLGDPGPELPEHDDPRRGPARGAHSELLQVRFAGRVGRASSFLSSCRLSRLCRWALVFDMATWHTATANTSEEDRRVCILRCAPPALPCFAQLTLSSARCAQGRRAWWPNRRCCRRRRSGGCARAGGWTTPWRGSWARGSRADGPSAESVGLKSCACL